MMKGKKLLMLLGSCCLALMLAVLLMPACAGPEPGPAPTPKPEELETFVWDIQTVHGALAFGTKVDRDFARRVAERTNNRLIINYFPENGLGIAWAEGFGLLERGEIPAFQPPMGDLGGVNPLFAIANLPMLATSAQEHMLMVNALREMFAAEFAKYNSVLLFQSLYTRQSITSTVPLVTIDDIQGLRWRTYDQPGAKLVDALGAQSLVLPWADVYMALQRGMMDVLCTGVHAFVDLSVWENTDYISDVAWSMGHEVFLVNKDAYEALPADIRAILVEEAWNYEARVYYEVVKANKESLNTCLSHGMEIVEASPELKSFIGEVSVNMWTEWAKENGPICEQAVALAIEALGK